MYVTTELVKMHLNIDADCAEEDVYIEHLIDAAEDKVIVDTCEDRDVLVAGGSLPAPLKQATLLLIGHWYANREPVSFATPAQIQLSYDSLIKSYRNYSK